MKISLVLLAERNQQKKLFTHQFYSLSAVVSLYLISPTCRVKKHDLSSHTLYLLPFELFVSDWLQLTGLLCVVTISTLTSLNAGLLSASPSPLSAHPALRGRVSNGGPSSGAQPGSHLLVTITGITIILFVSYWLVVNVSQSFSASFQNQQPWFCLQLVMHSSALRGLMFTMMLWPIQLVPCQP